MRYFFGALMTLLMSVSTTAFAAEAGSLVVSVAPAQTGSFPIGAQRVPMLTLMFSASCDADVHIRAITVHHTGLGATTDISKVYALEHNIRISRGAILQRIRSAADIRFNPPLTITACDSRTITVAMDVSANAATGSEHALTLTTEDILTDVSVQMHTSPWTATQTAAPGTTGSVAFSLAPLPSRNVLYGTDRTLLRFTLKADGKRDQLIDAITFTNDGSARNGDLQYLVIKSADGERLSDTVASLTKDTVRLTFSTPLRIARNQTRLLTLNGDVTASRRRTIDLNVVESGDIEARAAGR